MGYKARKTEHSGAKKGCGAYWGIKSDAKGESNRLRREHSKDESIIWNDNPYERVDEGCEVCMNYVDDCTCPVCPTCGVQGDPSCAKNHVKGA